MPLDQPSAIVYPKKKKNPLSLKAMYFLLCLRPPAKADASLQGVSVKVVEAPAAVITNLKKGMPALCDITETYASSKNDAFEPAQWCFAMR